MPKVTLKTKKNVLLLSVFSAATVLIIGYYFFGVGAIDDLVFFSIIIAITPTAILNYFDYNWRKSIDEGLPELFRNLVQAQEAGMTLPQALEEAVKREHGPLKAELRRMTVQISWGASFEEALLAFGRRVGTVLSQRTVPMIIEANHAGGHIEKVFDPMGKFIQSTLLLEKERKTQTRPYTAIIYIALFVFLFTVVILFRTFYTGVDGLSLFSAPTASSMDLKRTFLHMALVQGFFGGLVAGKMGEGSMASGLKHSVAMMLMGYLAIRFFL